MATVTSLVLHEEIFPSYFFYLYLRNVSSVSKTRSCSCNITINYRIVFSSFPPSRYPKASINAKYIHTRKNIRWTTIVLGIYVPYKTRTCRRILYGWRPSITVHYTSNISSEKWGKKYRRMNFSLKQQRAQTSYILSFFFLVFFIHFYPPFMNKYIKIHNMFFSIVFVYVVDSSS